MIEQEIVDWVLHAADTGRLDAGEALPSENILAQRFNVPRATVRRALGRLEEMGKVVAYQGRGRFLVGAVPTVSLALGDNKSFSEKVRRDGHDLRNSVLRCAWTKPTVDMKERLGLNDRERVCTLSRLRIVDGEYLAVHVSFLPESRFPDIEEVCREIDSIYAYFADQGFPDLQSGPTYLSVRLPSPEEQDILQMPALIPVLVIDSDSRTADGNEVIQLARITYRGDGFRYRV